MKEKDLKHILQKDYNFNENWKFILNLLFGKIDYFSTPSNPFSEEDKVKSAEQIVLLEKEGQPERISIYSKCRVSGTDNNGVRTNDIEQFDTIKDCYIEMCTRFGIEPSNDLSKVFDYDGKNFNEKLIEINGE